MSAPVASAGGKGVILLALILCCFPTIAQDVTERPADTLAARRDEARRSREEYVRGIPALEKPVHIQDIFTVHRDANGVFSLSTTIGDAMSRGPTWIKVQGDSAIISASAFGYTGPKSPFGLQFIHTDHSNPDLIQTSTFVNFTQGHLSIQRTAERLNGNDVVSFNASARGVTVTVVRTDESNRRQVSTAAADSFEKLRAENGPIFHTHVRPILLDLGMHAFGGVSADDAFAVFADELPVDEKAVATVRTLLPQLTDPQFSVREKALASLRELGRAGALAIRKIDRTGLSDQQTTLLDAAISSHPSIPAAEAERHRRDPHFLLDCLYLDDATIRNLALTQLKKALSKPDLELDIAAPLDQRSPQIESIRRTLPR